MSVPIKMRSVTSKIRAAYKEKAGWFTSKDIGLILGIHTELIGGPLGVDVTNGMLERRRPILETSGPLVRFEYRVVSSKLPHCLDTNDIPQENVEGIITSKDTFAKTIEDMAKAELTERVPTMSIEELKDLAGI